LYPSKIEGTFYKRHKPLKFDLFYAYGTCCFVNHTLVFMVMMEHGL